MSISLIGRWRYAISFLIVFSTLAVVIIKASNNAPAAALILVFGASAGAALNGILANLAAGLQIRAAGNLCAGQLLAVGAPDGPTEVRIVGFHWRTVSARGQNYTVHMPYSWLQGMPLFIKNEEVVNGDQEEGRSAS